MLHHFACWYVKCVKKVPFRKSGHIFALHSMIHVVQCQMYHTTMYKKKAYMVIGQFWGHIIKYLLSYTYCIYTV